MKSRKFPYTEILFITFLFCIGGMLQAQKILSPPLPVLVTADTAQHTSLNFRISNQEFVYDAEFFYPVEPGYTLLGVQLQPELHYQVNPDFILTGGIHLLKYSGMSGFVQARPVMSAVYRFSTKFSLVLGTLNGSLSHGLPEPLYKYDLSFSDYIEEGIQANVNTSFLKGDYWIDWRSFIQPGDPHQEELVFGTATVLSVFPALESWHIKIPVYTLVFHRGGQIDRSPLPVRTFGNLAGGFMVERSVSNSMIDGYGFDFLVFHYFDVSGTPLFPFTSGTAIYPKVNIGLGKWSVSGGYWWSDHFFSLTGEPQFASVSEDVPGISFSDRQLIRMRIGYHRSLSGGPLLYFFTDGYWDLNRSAFDYSLGLQLIFNRVFDLIDL